jgi:pimeloyl-ACP methyl ester carboxylesterase
VLDSVYPPAVETYALLAPNAARAIDQVFVACGADAECAAAYPGLEQTFLDTVALLDDGPVEVELVDPETGERYEHVATGYDLIDAVFLALYDVALIPDVPAAITWASSGKADDVGRALRTLSGAERYGPGPEPVGDEPPNDSDGLYYSVSCTEEMPITDAAEIDAAAEAVDPTLRDDLRSSADYDVEICGVWDAGQQDQAPLEPVRSDVPTLLLSGRFDPITPPSWAYEAARGLSQGHHVRFDHAGHGVMDSDACGLQVVLAFLDDPSRPPDASCETEGRLEFTLPR